MLHEKKKKKAIRGPRTKNWPQKKHKCCIWTRFPQMPRMVVCRLDVYSLYIVVSIHLVLKVRIFTFRKGWFYFPILKNIVKNMHASWQSIIQTRLIKHWWPCFALVLMKLGKLYFGCQSFFSFFFQSSSSQEKKHTAGEAYSDKAVCQPTNSMIVSRQV